MEHTHHENTMGKADFSSFDLHPKLLETARHMGFASATLIQQKCIPEIQKGSDVMGQSGTGSGKTVAFALPILQKIQPGAGIQALILTPTRELCVQVAEVFAMFGKPLRVHVTTVYGGVGIHGQINQLQNTDIVVATPGRMLDHMQRRTINLGRVRFLVLDEADKMFEMGFFDDVERIIKAVPQARQTMLFSATIDPKVHVIMKKYLRNPVILKAEENVNPGLLKQGYYIVGRQDKFSLLAHLLKNKTPGLAIVFCGMRYEVDKVAKNLRKNGVEATAIHGGITQNKRERALNSLRNEDSLVLVATDVAARGIDVKNISHIYNYDLPKTPDDYVHRIGRTARAGSKGDAVTLISQNDERDLRRILEHKKMKAERYELPEFERIIPPARSPDSPKDARSFHHRQDNQHQERGNRDFHSPARHSGSERKHFERDDSRTGSRSESRHEPRDGPRNESRNERPHFKKEWKHEGPGNSRPGDRNKVHVHPKFQKFRSGSNAPRPFRKNKQFARR